MGKVYLGSRVSDLDTGEPVHISRVNLLVDSEHFYTAGDDSGRTIEKTVPWASQAMADSILSSLQNVEYRPYSGLDGFLDPAAEVGDGVTLGGVYSVLGQTDIVFDGLGTADVSAPGGDEAEDEYPYKSRARRQAERDLAKTRSMILKTADEITLRVENELKEVYAQIVIELDSIESTVQGLNGEISSVRQYANNISATVTDLNGTVTVTLNTLNGLTVKDASGETRIKGSSIDTTTIRANSIDADKLNLTGSISFSDLSASVRNDIGDAYSAAEDAYNEAYTASKSIEKIVEGTYYNGTFINGDSIYSPNIYGGKFYGEEFSVIAGSNYGSFNIYANILNSRYCMFEIYYQNVIAPEIYISSPAGATIYFNGSVDFQNATVTGL